MSLIAMCAYCTEENGKLRYLKQTIESLSVSVNWKQNRLIIINNSTYKHAIKYLDSLNMQNWSVLHQKENLGTAEGINIAMRRRHEGEFFVKCDDDWTTEYENWVENMERVISENPEIGILGLKRDDVYGELIEDGDVLWNNDIMGTCTMYNPLLIDKIGALAQFSQYSFDDSIYSVRSIAAGFKNAFMKDIRIVNLDEGGTEYTEWKKREASLYLQEASIYMEKIKKGEISYFVEL